MIYVSVLFEHLEHFEQFFYIQSIFFSLFIFITLIILIVFFSGQINHLYDVKDSVYNNFIIEKHAVVFIMKIVCRTLQYIW